MYLHGGGKMPYETPSKMGENKATWQNAIAVASQNLCQNEHILVRASDKDRKVEHCTVSDVILLDQCVVSLHLVLMHLKKPQACPREADVIQLKCQEPQVSGQPLACQQCHWTGSATSL